MMKDFPNITMMSVVGFFIMFFIVFLKKYEQLDTWMGASFFYYKRFFTLHLMRKPNYDEGLKTRYDNAIKEFRNNAVKSLKITNDYVDENIHRLESKATIEPIYVDGSLRLLCLPKWRLEVFGEDYIVLATSEFKHNNA